MILALILAAQPVLKAPSHCNVEGVTKDGRYLVWSGSDYEDDDVRVVVTDLVTGAEVVRLDRSPDDSQPPTEGAKWRDAHPSTPLTKGRLSADKTRTLGIDVGDAVNGSWVGDSWSSQGGEWTMTVTRAGKTTPVAKMSVASSIDTFWTPDGKHTVFVAHHSGHMMRDPGFDELIIGTDGSPAVGLAVEKAKLKDADKVAAALGKAGFTVVSVTSAQKARDKSVVYAAAGSEPDAQKLAAAVPGGATVEKMSWKSALPLVVALGPAALK